MVIFVFNYLKFIYAFEDRKKRKTKTMKPCFNAKSLTTLTPVLPCNYNSVTLMSYHINLT